jgi:hypothetical protein
MKFDRAEVRSLSRLRERAGVRVSPRVVVWREPSPGATRRPLPQAGEVEFAGRPIQSTRIAL